MPAKHRAIDPSLPQSWLSKVPTNPAQPESSPLSDTIVQSVAVHRAEAFRVSHGANMGDALSFMGDVELNDIYEFRDAPRQRLSFHAAEDGQFSIAADSEIGRAGARLFLDSVMMFMTSDGQSTDILTLVETGADGHVENVFLLPLTPLIPDTEYTLVGLDRDGARARFAQVACVSFTRGTHITLASGAQVRIEDLRVGDKVLTRDDGAREIRWIGQSTVRASGDFAPILIRAGVLNNAGDLLVSPDHRLFVYQRTDRIGTGHPELLVKARHLVNGDTVTVRQGGFVEYFQILFDRHHIIYAEGIAAESMLIDSRTRPALPSELLAKLSEVLPDHGARNDHGIDVQKALLERPDAIDILRRASQR